MVVASMFLNRMRWELWWVFAGYVVCLKNIVAMSPEGTNVHPVIYDPPLQEYVPLNQRRP